MPSELSPRARLVLGALLVVLVPMLAGCSPGVTPSVCAVCDDRFEDTASRHGVNVSIAHSELHLYLREDGSARWIARVRLSGTGVEEFRTNETFRRTVVEQRVGSNGGPAPGDTRNRSVAMEGRTLVVAFDDPRLAEGHAGGVLVVDEFNYQPSSAATAPFAQRSDRIVLHPPDGWTVLNRQPGATARPGAVVWRDGIHERTYVVVGPDASGSTAAWGELAVATEVASWAAIPAIGVSVVPTLLLGGGLVLALLRVENGRRRGLDLGADWELAGSMTVTGLAVLAATGAVVRWHVAIADAIGTALEPFAGSGLVSSIPAIVLFVVLLLLPPVLGFAASGLFAHRRPALRWPPAIVAAATAPLEALWLVLVTPELAEAYLVAMALWGGVALVLGLGVFVIVRRVGRDRQWFESTDEAPDGRPDNERAWE